MMIDDMRITQVLAHIIPKFKNEFRLEKEENYLLNKSFYLKKVKKKLEVLKNFNDKSVNLEDSHFLG